MRAARSLAGSTTTTTCVLTPRSVAARQSRRQVRARDPPRGWPPTPLRPPPPLPSDEGDGGSEGMASSSNHQMTKEASRSKRKSLLKPRTLEMCEGAEGLRSHRVELACHLDGQALARELVDDVEHAI